MDNEKLRNNINTVLLNNSNEKDYNKLTELIMKEINEVESLYDNPKGTIYTNTAIGFESLNPDILKSQKDELLSIFSKSSKTNCLECDELKNKIDSLFDMLAHGDEKHRNWLKEAIKAHFTNKPPPEYK